ncbi:hypothetical protein NMG60_11006157 [Bertholletia excelsa]
MEPPPITATTVADSVDSLQEPISAKVRLMCSYGGNIVPRPHNKSLYYAGGDTRIVAIDRRATAASLAAFTAHLSRVLYSNRPFVLKYQLPNEDLDSLISVATDEDLQNMLEEHDRIASSPNPSRIRLFLFAAKPESVGSVLHDPKAESWFCDALKSTRIMQRGQSAESGLVSGLNGLDCSVTPDASLEAQIENLGIGGEAKNGVDFSSVPESMVLETSSSFGSTSSSISMSNLPPIGVHGDDGGLNTQDKKAKVLSTGSVESDNTVTSSVAHPQTAICQDPVVHLPSMETRVSSTVVESEKIACDAASAIPMTMSVQVPAYQVPLQSDQTQHQREVPYVQPGGHYIPQYSAGQMPISSFYPLYYSTLPQQTHSPYPPNPPYPVFLLPVRPTHSYNMPTVLNPVQVHPPATVITPQGAYKEVMATASPPELSAKVYRTEAGATPLVDVPSNQNQQPLVDLSEMHLSSQPVAPASKANVADFEDDFAYAQIYKTQPSAPALLAQYQTLSNSGTMLLSEASKRQQADNSKKHIRTQQ